VHGSPTERGRRGAVSPGTRGALFLLVGREIARTRGGGRRVAKGRDRAWPLSPAKPSVFGMYVGPSGPARSARALTKSPPWSGARGRWAVR